jgi:hypothetical protein
MNNTQIKAEAMANVARMHIECGEVLERLSKLLAFSITQDFFALPLGQQKLMKRTSPQDGRISLHPFGESFFPSWGLLATLGRLPFLVNLRDKP